MIFLGKNLYISFTIKQLHVIVYYTERHSIIQIMSISNSLSTLERQNRCECITFYVNFGDGNYEQVNRIIGRNDSNRL